MVVGDITATETRAAILFTATSSFGGIDALINNAGVISVGPLANAHERALKLRLDVNVLAPMLLVRGLSDALRRELAAKGITVTYVAPRAAKTAASGAFEHLIEPMQMKLDAPNW